MLSHLVFLFVLFFVAPEWKMALQQQLEALRGRGGVSSGATVKAAATKEFDSSMSHPLSPEDVLLYREDARRMFIHGYDSYKEFAFPHDELKPLTGGRTAAAQISHFPRQSWEKMA